MFDMILLKFFTQCTAIDAKVYGSFRLVVLTMMEHGLQHGLLDFRNNRIKQVTGYFSIQIMQILANSLFNRLLQ